METAIGLIGYVPLISPCFFAVFRRISPRCWSGPAKGWSGWRPK